MWESLGKIFLGVLFAGVAGAIGYFVRRRIEKSPLRERAQLLKLGFDMAETMQSLGVLEPLMEKRAHIISADINKELGETKDAREKLTILLLEKIAYCSAVSYHMGNLILELTPVFELQKEAAPMIAAQVENMGQLFHATAYSVFASREDIRDNLSPENQEWIREQMKEIPDQQPKSPSETSTKK